MTEQLYKSNMKLKKKKKKSHTKHHKFIFSEFISYLLFMIVKIWNN